MEVLLFLYSRLFWFISVKHLPRRINLIQLKNLFEATTMIKLRSRSFGVSTRNFLNDIHFQLWVNSYRKYVLV